jgi:hypothetical protein
LDRFRPGRQYVLGNSLGALFLAEGWAEPVEDDEPAQAVPPTKYLDEMHADRPRIPNLIRDIYPPYYGSLAQAADHRRTKRVTRVPSRARSSRRRALRPALKKN